jgi:hypothetical protein
MSVLSRTETAEKIRTHDLAKHDPRVNRMMERKFRFGNRTQNESLLPGIIGKLTKLSRPDWHQIEDMLIIPQRTSSVVSSS